MLIVRRAKILTILSIMVAGACSDPGMLLPIAGDKPEIQIQSVQNGSILLPEDTFQISLDYDGDKLQPDRLVIELLTEINVLLFSQELGEDEILELPLPVALPEDLADGYYTVIITVFQEGETVSQEESTFFFVTKEYAIAGLTPYPQFFYPGGKGLVLADLKVPEDADPYLRWTSSGEILLEGRLSERADALQLDVPDREGIYSLELEVFPFGPRTAEIFTFQSPIVLEAQFFVSKDQDEETAELYPDENYFSLFHFRGEHIDWGTYRTGNDATAIGDPEIALVDGIFGFRFDDYHGFAVDDILIPIVDYLIKPFSFSMRYAPEHATGEFYSVSQEDGDTVFSVGYSDEGILFAKVQNVTSSIAGKPVATVGASELTVSIVPGADSIRFLWFLNGFLMSDDVKPYESAPIAAAGRTVIGGTEGFRGVIDEIGIFYRITDEGVEVDTEVYARAMERQYGEDLVFAEGFDGLKLVEQINYVGAEGDVSVDGGSLFLANGSEIELPPISAGFEMLSITLSWTGGAGSLSVSVGGEDFKIADLGGEGTYILPGATIVETEFIDLEVRDGALGIALDSAWRAVAPINDDIVFGVTNTSEDEATELKGLLILNNRIHTEEEI